jgi:hypothetical protein
MAWVVSPVAGQYTLLNCLDVQAYGVFFTAGSQNPAQSNDIPLPDTCPVLAGEVEPVLAVVNFMPG